MIIIKKGDKFKCKKDYFMDDDFLNDNNIAYKEGKIYQSEVDNCLTDEYGDITHTMTGYDENLDDSEYDDFEEYFEKVEDTDSNNANVIFEKGKYYKCIQNFYCSNGAKYYEGHAYKSPRDNYLTGENGIDYRLKADSLSTIKQFFNIPNTNSVKNDKVNHPSHYTWLKDKCGIEVIDITRHLDFDLGNALKYILRCGHKSEADMTDNEKAIEDLKKAVFYLNDKIMQLEQQKP